MERIRRPKLIVPNGPGGIIDLPGNVSVVVGGPHQWAQANPQYYQDNKVTDDPRLANYLGVDHFRMPPPAENEWGGNGNNNAEPRIPVFRFPGWHHCKTCGKMERLSRTAPMSKRCGEAGCQGELIPFRFVAVCDQGHLDDVDLVGWVHEGKRCTHGVYGLTYRTVGGADNLTSIVISCACGTKDHPVERSLAGIMGRRFWCRGRRPWLGSQDKSEACALEPNMEVVVKGGSNVYYPKVESGLFIPVAQDDHEAVLSAFWNTSQDKIREHAMLDEARIQLRSWLDAKHDGNAQFAGSGISLDRLVGYVNGKLDGVEGAPISDDASERERFRYREFEVFKTEGLATHPDLSTRTAPGYKWQENNVPDGLVEQVVLLDKLRETRVLTGFQRLKPDVVTDRQQLRSLMWGPIAGNWLPAIIVRGEGIFVRFNDDVLDKWEKDERVQGQFASYLGHIPQEKRPVISPRFLFLHTLAHMLLRRLTFECGYGSSSLRERIYCHQLNTEEKMNAIVIYTASGDSEGSLGGLVNQGEPDRLESMIRQSMEDAEWCSSDPVCSDLGLAGRGPDSVNGAACHNCALVPETSCEYFNKYLDRKFVIDIRLDIPSLFTDSIAATPVPE